MAPVGFSDRVSFLWRVADNALGVLPGDRKTLGKSLDEGVDLMLKRTAGQRFYSLSTLTFTAMLQNDREFRGGEDHQASQHRGQRTCLTMPLLSDPKRRGNQ